MPPHGHLIGTFCQALDKIFYAAENTGLFPVKENGKSKP
jgi:hypothetical protein